MVDLTDDHNARCRWWDAFPRVASFSFNGLLMKLRDFDMYPEKKHRFNAMLKPELPTTAKVEMPGGQSRLRQIILYVAHKCEGAKYFGAIKLNKIIWKADFDAFAARKLPVTGREYRRQKFGPALREILPVHREMLRDGAIRIERRDFGDDFVEHRTIAIDQPNTRLFTEEDLAFVDAAIRHYWDMTGMETSDESHGVAWKTRNNGDPMPYELAFLSDEPLDSLHLRRVEDLIYDKGWISE